MVVAAAEDQNFEDDSGCWVTGLLFEELAGVDSGEHSVVVVVAAAVEVVAVAFAVVVAAAEEVFVSFAGFEFERAAELDCLVEFVLALKVVPVEELDPEFDLVLVALEWDFANEDLAHERKPFEVEQYLQSLRLGQRWKLKY